MIYISRNDLTIYFFNICSTSYLTDSFIKDTTLSASVLSNAELNMISTSFHQSLGVIIIPP